MRNKAPLGLYFCHRLEIIKILIYDERKKTGLTRKLNKTHDMDKKDIAIVVAGLLEVVGGACLIVSGFKKA